jgi:hypothetical protein
MCQRGYRVVVVTNSACQLFSQKYHEEVNGFEVNVLDDYLSIGSIFQLGKVLKCVFQPVDGLLKHISKIRYRNAYIGRHALATLSADNKLNMAMHDLYATFKLTRAVARSIFWVDAANLLLKHLNPSVVLSMEKGFIGTAELFYASIDNGVRYIQWTGCHEPNSIMFKKYEWNNFREHPFSISEDNWKIIKEMPWDDKYENVVMQQFQHGYTEGQWFKYKNLTTNQREFDRLTLIQDLAIDLKKKTAVIYSHILNDANLFYGEDIFEGGFEEWLIETVRAAALNRSVNWVLKLHPANMYRHPTLVESRNYGELQALERAFGCVPDFLTVVYPDSPVSPLSFFGITDYCVTVRGTVGLELPCFGVPTLTAGTGRYSGKGFTIDSLNREEYIFKIRNLDKIQPLTLEQTRLGQRYAYYIFRVRPARYHDVFVDEYSTPKGHPHRRDLNFDDKTLQNIIDHPQIVKMISFLCSNQTDFLDESVV